MDPPIVYIEKEPFIIMLRASIEPFDRECLGDIGGRPPSRNGNYFHITSVSSIQLAKKRKNMEIQQSKAGKKRLDELDEQYPRLFSKIGDFHSHPEWRGHHRLPEMSNEDLKDMMNHRELKVCIVIKVSRINKERILWESLSGGGLKGSLGKYKFHMNAFRLVGNSAEMLKIQAPAAVKSLNRALGYF